MIGRVKDISGGNNEESTMVGADRVWNDRRIWD